MGHLETPARSSQETRWLILVAVTVAVGIASGLGGMALGLLLRFVQHIAYDYSLHAIIGRESFLQGVSASSPLRRVVALGTCGAVSGIGWWTLYRFRQSPGLHQQGSDGQGIQNAISLYNRAHSAADHHCGPRFASRT